MEIKRVTTPAGKRLEIALKNLQGKVAKVGWFENSKYPAVPSKVGPTQGIPVASVAATQEYGYPSKGIPARPFVRPTIAAEENSWKAIAKEGSKQVLAGNQDIGDVMEAIGMKAAGDIRKAITLVFEPPLSPRTIAARLARLSDKKTVGGLTKPLIDTGIMLGTLTNTVESE